ncbi:MAG: DUF4177 domain-containing protein [Planctomycetes bacterium]|nr:DUF4177 domain-containing protein [Planctomycetota bacterium]
MIAKRFEYETVFFEPGGFVGGKLNKEEFDAALARMGDRGWELVSCFDTNQGYGATRFVVAVFKREASPR